MMPGPRCPAGERGRPGRGGGTARSGPGRRAGARSSPFPRPLPCPPRARQPWPLARPAGAPPSLSCGASALSSSCHYSGRDPSSEQASPSPARKCGGGRGCVSKRKAGESGEQSGDPACERERGRGVTGLRPGCTTPCPASPLTRVPGSPAPSRPAPSAGDGDFLRSAPLRTPPPPAPAPGLDATRHGGAGTRRRRLPAEIRPGKVWGQK